MRHIGREHYLPREGKNMYVKGGEKSRDKRTMNYNDKKKDVARVFFLIEYFM